MTQNWSISHQNVVWINLCFHSLVHHNVNVQNLIVIFDLTACHRLFSSLLSKKGIKSKQDAWLLLAAWNTSLTTIWHWDFQNGQNMNGVKKTFVMIFDTMSPDLKMISNMPNQSDWWVFLAAAGLKRTFLIWLSFLLLVSKVDAHMMCAFQLACGTSKHPSENPINGKTLHKGPVAHVVVTQLPTFTANRQKHAHTRSKKSLNAL